MTTTAAGAQKSGGIGKDLIVYVCLLALAGLIFTVSVLLGMQYGWTDSFRMVNGAPFSK